MAKKKTNDIVVNDVEIVEAKPKLSKKRYVLINDLVTHKGVKKAGTMIWLTEEGRKYLKSINKIK